MATHHSVKTFSQKHPAYTEASLRFIIFTRRTELKNAGALVQRGRKIILLEEPLLRELVSGEVA